MRNRLFLVWPSLLLVSISLFLGCASSFQPRPLEETNFQQCAQTQAKGNFRVTAAVLSAEETEAAFGFALYKKGVQPIWLEIENKDKEPLWFLPISLDPAYFTPLESAYLSRYAIRKSDHEELDRYFFKRGMGNHIGPG